MTLVLDVLHAIGGVEQVIRPCSDWLVAYLSCVGDHALIGWLPTSPV
jgi:hypothetical protein